MMNTARFFSSQQESSTILGSILHDKKLTTIHKKVIKIDSILKDSFLLRKKLQSIKSVKKSQFSFVEKEKNLEKTKIEKPEKEIKKISAPKGGGIFGWIGNFINNVIFGFIAVRFIQHLPKLLTLIPVINSVMDGIIDWGGKILDGLVTFIDWGYSAYDNTVKVFAKFGGEGAAKKFEDFMSKFKNVVQYSIFAGMLFSDLALSGGGGGGGGIGDVVGDVTTEVVVDQVKKQVVRQVGAQAARSAAVPVAGAIGMIVGAGLLASALGEGAFQLKKFSKKIEKDAFKKRDELKKNWQKTPAWNILSKAWNLVQYSFFETYVIPGIRLTNWMLNGIGVTLDIIGAPFRYAIELIRWALMALNNDTKGMAEQRKNLGKFDARIRDGIREHFAGFLGPIFRVIGRKDWADKIEKQGSWGSLYGDKAVKDMYGYASGGSTRGGQYSSATPRREIRPQRNTRRITVKPPKLYQGRTVGGIDNIQKVFPEPEDIKSPSGTPSQRKEETMNPYGFMSKSYYRLASVPFVGPILAMPLKVMMGDSIDSSYYTGIGQGFDALISKAYQEGALSKDFPIQDFDFEKIISKSVQQLASKEMVSVRSELMRQLGLEKVETVRRGSSSEEDCYCPSDEHGGGSLTGGTADFWALAAIASLESGHPQGRADVAQSVYNRVKSNLNFGQRSSNIKDYIIAPGEYSPVHESNPALWAAITDRQSAIAAVESHSNGRGRGSKIVDEAAAAIRDPALQSSAASFIGGRTDFWSTLRGDPGGVGHVIRHGHRFGWFAGPAAISYGRSNPGPAGVPSFGNLTSSSPRSTPIAPSSPATDVSDCSCDGDNIPGTDGLNTATNPEEYGEGRGKQIYLHWTAGNYTGVPRGSYHTVITGDGGIHNVIPYTQKGEHTYKRNTNSVGLSLAAMGGRPDPWSISPTSTQLSGMALETSKIAKAWGWSASDINIRNVLTHAEAASNKDGKNMHDNYGPREWGGTGERWDLFKLQKGDPDGSGGDRIRSMIKAKMGSAGRFGGGPINEGLTKVHPGEFVIDKDSVDAFGIEFISKINQVENRSQLRRAKESLIQILQEKVPFYSNRSQDQYIVVSSSQGKNTSNRVVVSNNYRSNNITIDSCPWKDVMGFGN